MKQSLEVGGIFRNGSSASCVLVERAQYLQLFQLFRNGIDVSQEAQNFLHFAQEVLSSLQLTQKILPLLWNAVLPTKEGIERLQEAPGDSQCLQL